MKTWERGDTIGLAGARCSKCRGLGLYVNARGENNPCACVLRAIFHACHREFRTRADSRKGPGVVRLERASGPSGRNIYGHKSEEFIADFYLISKRTLNESEWRIFRFRYLLGAETNLCARPLRMSVSNICQHCSRIEAKLGRAFRDTSPYALFPIDGYFSPPVLGERVLATVVKTQKAA